MTLAALLALTIPVSAIALLYARREYRRGGKLSLTGLLLLCAMLFVPNLVLEYATRYAMPETILDYIGESGTLEIVAGLVFVVAGSPLVSLDAFECASRRQACAFSCR